MRGSLLACRTVPLVACLILGTAPYLMAAPLGTLVVSSDIPGTGVAVADQRVDLSGAPATVGLEPGQYELCLADGYGEVRRTAMVRPGETTRVSISWSDLSPAELHALGSARFDRGAYEEAVPFFKVSAEAAPASVAFRNDLGLALHLSGRADEARRVLEGAVRSDPGSAAAHFNLAGVLVTLGEREAALWEYNQARKFAPDDPNIRNDLAATLLEMGWVRRAELEYAGLTRSHPQYANGWFGYAACLERSRKAARAKQAWQQFLALAGDDADSEFVRVAKDHVAGKR